MPEKYTPKSGEVVVVTSIPQCNFECEKPGPYDFKTIMGPWANGCLEHYQAFRAFPDLGVGKAQIWITEDQVAS
jgi:hypothetical protein